MNAIQVISKIQDAESIIEIFPNYGSWQKTYQKLGKIIHPDICNEAGAHDAMQKLNEWKDYLENGKTYKDDVSDFTTNGHWVNFKSSIQNLNWSIENYRLMMQLKSDADKNFQRYLPKECIIQPDNSYQFVFDKRAIPLTDIQLPQEHVNWVLNRILEYCAYLSEIGFVHCGINPESIFIVPETHGIQIMSFYHLTRTGNKIGTVSGKYKHWYPSRIFNDKTAFADIDIECAKKTAAYLLGEKSGSAIKLRKTHNENFVNFLIKSHDNAYSCLMEFKKLLKDNFKTQFHSLTI